MTKIKRCPKCKTDQPADTRHFYNDSKSESGLSCWCKNCQRAALKKRNNRKKKNQDALEKELFEGNTTKQDMTLTLDFSGNEILLKDIKALAIYKLRTPEMQVMWLAGKSLYKERNQANEHN